MRFPYQVLMIVDAVDRAAAQALAIEQLGAGAGSGWFQRQFADGRFCACATLSESQFEWLTTYMAEPGAIVFSFVIWNEGTLTATSEASLEASIGSSMSAIEAIMALGLSFVEEE